MGRRTDKISSQLLKEISQIVHDELTDPRIGFVTFTHAEVSPDLSQARIFFTVLGKDKEKKSTYYGLRSASKYLRHALYERLRLKKVPELEFVYDESMDKGMRVYEKIVELQKESRDEEGSDNSK